MRYLSLYAASISLVLNLQCTASITGGNCRAVRSSEPAQATNFSSLRCLVRCVTAGALLLTQGAAVPNATQTDAPTPTNASWALSNFTTYSSLLPSDFPTASPTCVPVSHPIFHPTEGPSLLPSVLPTLQPSPLPSTPPSLLPSKLPTAFPSDPPTQLPSPLPSTPPSLLPSRLPTASPSDPPTQLPSGFPSYLPTQLPTELPSGQPSNLPSVTPTFNPSQHPSTVPSTAPTLSPSNSPSLPPLSASTHFPYVGPTSANLTDTLYTSGPKYQNTTTRPSDSTAVTTSAPLAQQERCPEPTVVSAVSFVFAILGATVSGGFVGYILGNKVRRKRLNAKLCCKKFDKVDYYAFMATYYGNRLNEEKNKAEVKQERADEYWTHIKHMGEPASTEPSLHLDPRHIAMGKMNDARLSMSTQAGDQPSPPNTDDEVLGQLTRGIHTQGGKQRIALPQRNAVPSVSTTPKQIVVVGADSSPATEPSNKFKFVM